MRWRRLRRRRPPPRAAVRVACLLLSLWYVVVMLLLLVPHEGSWRATCSYVMWCCCYYYLMRKRGRLTRKMWTTKPTEPEAREFKRSMTGSVGAQRRRRERIHRDKVTEATIKRSNVDMRRFLGPFGSLSSVGSKGYCGYVMLCYVMFLL
jgi:hypothetical protein